MIKAYAEPASNRTGGNTGRNTGGNILQRAGRAIRTGAQNVVNRLRGRG